MSGRETVVQISPSGTATREIGLYLLDLRALSLIRPLDSESRLADGAKEGEISQNAGGGNLFFPFHFIYTHATQRSAYSPSPPPSFPHISPTSILTMSVTSEEEGTYPPSKLGEYTVIQEIGEGTFGKVKSK